MTDLRKKYRAAPRQESPARLDDFILASASRQIPVKKPEPPLFSPLRAMTASFCVVGLGVALVLRNGPPPLHNESTDVAGVTRKSMADDIAADSASLPMSGELMASNSARLEAESLDLAKDEQTIPASTAESVLSPVVEVAKPSISYSEPTAGVAFDRIDLAEQSEITVVETDALAGRRLKRKSVAKSEAFSISDEQLAEVGPELNLRTHVQSDGIAALQADVEMLSAQPAEHTVNKRNAVSASVNSNAAGFAGSSNSRQSPDQRSGLAAVSWLGNQLESHFTIQLATAADSEYLVNFGDSLDLPRPWYVVQDDSGQRLNYRLLFGVFETFDDARTGIEYLDETARQFKPIVRNFAKLQEKQ